MREDLISQLKEKGLKLTPQRLAIVDVLVDHRGSHPGATLIFGSSEKSEADQSFHCLCDAQRVFSTGADQRNGIRPDGEPLRYRSLRPHQSHLQSMR